MLRDVADVQTHVSTLVNVIENTDLEQHNTSKILNAGEIILSHK